MNRKHKPEPRDRRALDVAWGKLDGPRPGPKPSLTLDEIVASAVELADSGGLGALSMPRMAARLGVTPMALYRYVPSKDALIFLAVDAASGGPRTEDEATGDWRRCIQRWAYAMLDGLDRHPWIAQVPILEPPLGPRQVAWMERCLECLSGTRLGEIDKLSVLNLLSSFVLGYFRLYSELTLAAAAVGTTREAAERQYVETLLEYLDPERFPRLLTAFTSVGGHENQSDRRDFEFGLNRILDGVEQMMPVRRRPRGCTQT